MSMYAYFRSDSDSKLRIRAGKDEDCLIVDACGKHGFMRDSVSFVLTSAERHAMIAVLRELDCTEADECAAEEAA